MFGVEPDRPCEGEGKARAEMVLVALVLAAMMSLALVGSAFADAPTGTITVNSPKTDPNAEKTYYWSRKALTAGCMISSTAGRV